MKRVCLKIVIMVDSRTGIIHQYYFTESLIFSIYKMVGPKMSFKTQEGLWAVTVKDLRKQKKMLTHARGGISFSLKQKILLYQSFPPPPKPKFLNKSTCQDTWIIIRKLKCILSYKAKLFWKSKILIYISLSTSVHVQL